MVNITTEEGRLALQDFLMNINELDRIEQKTSKFNAFEMLGIVNTEIRHSNVLGWLISPGESHDLGEVFIKKMIQLITRNYGGDFTEYDPLTLLLWDYHDLEVRREWFNIDLVAFSNANKFILVIENKIWSKESSHQLKKYQEIIESDYPDYNKMYVYLTPFGHESSNPEVWKSINYSQVLEVIEAVMELKKDNIESSVKQFIEQYIDILRRHVVGDHELEKICQDIYFKHKKALDLIFEYRPDTQSDIFSLLKESIEKNDDLILDDSSKTLIRFTTKRLNHLIPTKGANWTASGRILLFEFQNYEKVLRLKLIIGPGDQNIRNDLYQITTDNPALFKGRNKRLTAAYTAMYLKNIFNHEEIYETGHEQMHEDISNRVESFLGNELKILEQKVLESYTELV